MNRQVQICSHSIISNNQEVETSTSINRLYKQTTVNEYYRVMK